MPKFLVQSDDADYDIQLQIRYAETANADEVLTALSQAYARAFNEIDSRLGQVRIN